MRIGHITIKWSVHKYIHNYSCDVIEYEFQLCHSALSSLVSHISLLLDITPQNTAKIINIMFLEHAIISTCRTFYIVIILSNKSLKWPFLLLIKWEFTTLNFTLFCFPVHMSTILGSTEIYWSRNCFSESWKKCCCAVENRLISRKTNVTPGSLLLCTWWGI